MSRLSVTLYLIQRHRTTIKMILINYNISFHIAHTPEIQINALHNKNMHTFFL